MKIPRDDFDLFPVLSKLSYFSDYLEDVEELIDSKARELDNSIKMMNQELVQNEEPPDAYTFFQDDYERIENVFPNLLRRSLFMYVFSVLEAGLNNCCRLLNYQGRQLTDEKYKCDKGIIKAKKYLKDAEVSFPDKQWGKITDYQKLRNCIAHSQGRLKGCKDKKNHLRNFVLKNPHLSLTYTDDEGNDMYDASEFVEVVFHKGFCEEVIQTISSFLEQLRISLENRHRNEQLFFEKAHFV